MEKMFQTAEERPFPTGPLGILAVGAILVEVKLHLTIGGIAVTQIGQLVGATLCLVALTWLWRGTKSDGLRKRELGVALGLFFGGMAIDVLGTWTPLTLPEWCTNLSSLAHASALLLAAFALRSTCVQKGWKQATRAWTFVLVTLSLFYVGPFVIVLALFMVSVATGNPITWTTQSLALLALVMGALALPTVLYQRATALTRLAQARTANRRLPTWARVGGHPVTVLALLGILLIPVWLMIPPYFHFTSTPTYAEFLADPDNESSLPSFDDFLANSTEDRARLVSKSEGRDVTIGEIVPYISEDRVTGVTQFRHHLAIQLTRADSTLLDLEHEVLVQVDQRDDPVGCAVSVQVRKSDHDPRYQLAVYAAIDEEGVFTSESEEGPEWVLPILFEVHLRSGAGPETFVTARVKGMPEPTRPGILNPIHAAKLMTALQDSQIPVFAPEVGQLLGLENTTPSLVGPPPPPPGEGQRFVWRGRPVFRIPRGERHVMGDEVFINYSSMYSSSRGDLEFSCNYDEYSFSTEAQQTLESMYSDICTASQTQTVEKAIDRTWNQEVW